MPSITHLNQLEADGLISLSQVIPEPAYWFRHALVQETAYQSLIRQDRRELHLAAGEVLEVIFQDKLEEHAPLLAHHFSLGGDDQRALQYYQTAAETAFRRYANAEAVMHYMSALRISNQPNIASDIPRQTWQTLTGQIRSVTVFIRISILLPMFQTHSSPGGPLAHRHR